VNVHEVLSRCHELGVILAVSPQGKLRATPPGKLPEELREQLRQRKAEVLALLTQQSAVWPCPHCGQPAEIEDVCPSLDGQRTLTLWRCEPCETWGVN
jgi:TubC N-terminal docking domain